MDRGRLTVLSVMIIFAASCSDHTPAKSTDSAAAVQDDCGANRLSAYVGASADEKTLAKIRAAHGSKALRVIRPGMAVTMDYRSDRLNLEVDEAGTIARLYCS